MRVCCAIMMLSYIGIRSALSVYGGESGAWWGEWCMVGRMVHCGESGALGERHWGSSGHSGYRERGQGGGVGGAVGTGRGSNRIVESRSHTRDSVTLRILGTGSLTQESQIPIPVHPWEPKLMT